jgi:neutral ceramidase
MPAVQYHRLGGMPRAPRRSMTALVSAVSCFILFVLFVSQWRAPHYAAKAQLKIGKAERPTNPFLQETRAAAASGDKYLLGVGKADITGPVVEIEFAGYASLSQTGTGLRQRLYSRAFIIGEVDNPDNRFVYVVIDTAAGDTGVRYGVLEGLASLGSNYSVYGQSNVAVTGTHSHSGPGAWFNYLLPQITSLGFDKQSSDAIVTGTLLSIQRAHESLTEVCSSGRPCSSREKLTWRQGYLSFGSTNISDANINRSLWSYLANPEAERALYTDNVDKTLTMLRFQRASDLKNIGVLTWFSVHGTSMLENNTHVTGDNKGVAAYLFEQAIAAEDDAADGFVAGFSQASVGDTTPNVLGAWCDDGSGQMCSLINSTCSDGKSEQCHGRGPEFQKLDLGVSSCYEIGRRQYAGAKDLYVRRIFSPFFLEDDDAGL